MMMQGRKYSSTSGYRYGFNGQEETNEIAGEGNSYTAEFWQYDSRIGRRWNLDPKPNISFSSYSCFAGNPIFYSDPYGDTTKLFSAKNGKYLRTINDNLPNQSHFIKPSQLLLANFKGGTNKLAERIRKNSVAFIGANTASDAQAIEESANKENHEVFFIGKISSTREIRLTAITLPKKAYESNSEINIGDYIDGAVSEKEQSASFLIGHTHQLSITKGSITDPTQPTPPGRSWWSYNDNGAGDYAPLLKRLVTKNDGTTAGQETYQKYERSQTPALILTHTGLTIYGTGTKYNPPGPYGGYGSVDNKIAPVQQSYTPYQSIRR